MGSSRSWEVTGAEGKSTCQGRDHGEEGSGCNWILPQVTKSGVEGRGGAVEEVRGGVGCSTTVRARGILGCPYPLPVGPRPERS